MRIIFLILCLLTFQAANCCTCLSLPRIDNEQYNKYDFIATGIAIRVEDDKWQRFIYLKVEKSYKSEKEKDTVQIISPNTEGECGITPEVGERWLVFAYTKDGKLHTSLCTRTKSMNPKTWNYDKAEIDDDIAFLEKKKDSSYNLVLLLSLVVASIVGIVWWLLKRKSR